jgi:uncharacterized protein (DUF58 family)
VTRRGRDVFPLVPRRRVSGVPFGERPSLRRGRGTDVAGTRPYVRGDPLAAIDWAASARLSTAHGGDEFVVRERYADESPRVLVVCDHGPTMALYGPPFPWLDKRRTLAAATRAIAASAVAARSAFGYLDHTLTLPRWTEPGRAAPQSLAERLEQATFDAPRDSLARLVELVRVRRADLPSGSFVFVLSDFLGRLPPEVLVRAAGERWELVPVVIEDPVWEQSFPLLDGVVVPVADPETGAVRDVRITARDARERKGANEARLERLLRVFRALGHDPVLLEEHSSARVARAFLAWAERRRVARRARR